jgi:hypothetical protein
MCIKLSLVYWSELVCNFSDFFLFFISQRSVGDNSDSYLSCLHEVQLAIQVVGRWRLGFVVFYCIIVYCHSLETKKEQYSVCLFLLLSSRFA